MALVLSAAVSRAARAPGRVVPSLLFTLGHLSPGAGGPWGSVHPAPRLQIGPLRWYLPGILCASGHH